jgi:ribosomal-protein-alanine N-acetyltransferase
MTVTRPIALDDAEALASLFTENREFLTPWFPSWEDWMFTVEGQRRAVAKYLERQGAGTQEPRVILDDGCVVGRINLTDIVRGAFMSCHLGYWVAESSNGRGLASRAVDEVVTYAFGELGLHRVQAGTLLHNLPSQRVLERNGFARFGLAPKYLRIAGRWQDHVLFQRIRAEDPEERG